jgi:hypothetical protein
MSAQQRAARAAAEIQRSRAAAETARGVTLKELGVRVEGNKVFSLNYLLRKEFRYLGPLAGACAGVMDLKTPTAGAMISSVVIGNPAKVGMIFVAFADGTRHEQSLRQGSRRQMQDVDAAVALFNAMVDVADADPKTAFPAARRKTLQQMREESNSDGLTYRECKPGRDASKAARRAGLSREEASKASRDALARVKEAKLKENRDGE